MKTFDQLLRASGERIGTWSQIASAEVIDMLGASGFDFTIIDCEHGYFGIETAEGLMRACDANGLTPIVRVPSSDRMWIQKALNAGAAAVVVPGVGSVEEARAAIAATRFAPEGTRGACPCVRAAGHFIRDWAAYAARQQGTGAILLIETRAGVEPLMPSPRSPVSSRCWSDRLICQCHWVTTATIGTPRLSARWHASSLRRGRIKCR